MYKLRSRRRKKNREFVLNLVPILDAIFALVFFLLSINTYNTYLEIGSDVPVFKLSSLDDIPKKKLIIKVNVKLDKVEVINNVDKKILFETQGDLKEQAVKLHEFLLVLKNENNTEEKVIIEVDSQVVYQDLVMLVDAIRQQKINNKIAPLFSKLMFYN